MTREISPAPGWRNGSVDAGRRRAVGRLVAALAAGTVGSSRALAQAGACALAPEVGEGPFYFDPELVRADITENRPGAPLDLQIQVVRAGDCATLADARVDLWHADADGLYSGYRRQRGTGATTPDAAARRRYLRGTQFTDADGSVAFRTIYPSWYRGRTPHVHFKVFIGRDERVASQIFFPEEVNERVFERWQPYREQRHRRDTYNSNDTFLRGRVGGVFCDIEDRAEGYVGSLVVAVR